MRRLVLWLLCCAFLLDVMSATSVFTAAPAIKTALDLTPAQLQWTITAATLPGAALLLAGGRLADVAGRKRMFLLGLALFSAASLTCGLAPSAPLLLTGRALLGVGGALLLPAALSLLLAVFDEPARRNRALATWSAIGGIGATAGMLLGGAVTQGLGWRWVFLVNVPTGLVVLALSALVVPERRSRESAPPVDLRATALFTAGLALLVYGVSQGPQDGWADWRTAGVAAVGAGCLVAFGVLQPRSPAPVVPPRLLRARGAITGNVTLLASGMCVDGLLFATTLYTQSVLGFGALAFGALSAVMTVASVAAAWGGQRAIARVGWHPVAVAGLLALCATCFVFVLATGVAAHAAVLVGGMVVFGLGMGFAYVAGSIGSLEGVAEQDAGVAAALQNISFGTGATLGVAILSTVAAQAGASSLTTGVRAAFLAGAVIAVLAPLAGMVIPAGRPRTMDGCSAGSRSRTSSSSATPSSTCTQA